MDWLWWLEVVAIVWLLILCAGVAILGMYDHSRHEE